MLMDPEKLSSTSNGTTLASNSDEINEATRKPLWSIETDQEFQSLVKRGSAHSHHRLTQRTSSNVAKLTKRFSSILPTSGSNVPSPDATLINDEEIVWVEWNGPTDPENPFNWSPRKKWTITAVTSFFTFLVALIGSSWPIGLGSFEQDMNVTNKELGLLTISIYPLGFGLAPLVLAPFSEATG